MTRWEEYLDDEAQWPPEEQGPERRPPRPPKAEILHADDSIVIVNKPAGIWQDHHPLDEPSVFDFLVQHGSLTEDDEPRFLFPIDAQVSGLCGVGLKQDIEVREMSCLAVVRGMIVTQDGTIELPIRRSEHGVPLKVNSAHGEPAATQWRLKDRFVGYALLECRPNPPLPDVVRAHLQALEIPLVVDPAYGGGSRFMLSSFKAGYRRSARHDERPLIARVSLHVQSFALNHPKSGERMEFAALPPKDFKATVHQLERFGRIP